jgi:cytochrome c-type biogenesis protein
MITQYSFGFMAGGLSLLAPCVLPLLPLIVNSSLRSSRMALLMSALGLTFSFTFFGLMTSAFSSVFDPDIIRRLGAIILVLVGLVILLPSFKEVFSTKLSFVGNLGAKLQSRMENTRARDQFLGGALLGMIWSPCTGPTLAVAAAFATQSDKFLEATGVFFFYGLGASVALISFGLLLKRWVFLRSKLLSAGAFLNITMGVLTLFIGVLILTGLEASLQEWLLGFTPNWLLRVINQ